MGASGFAPGRAGRRTRTPAAARLGQPCRRAHAAVDEGAFTGTAAAAKRLPSVSFHRRIFALEAYRANAAHEADSSRRQCARGRSQHCNPRPPPRGAPAPALATGPPFPRAPRPSPCTALAQPFPAVAALRRPRLSNPCDPPLAQGAQGPQTLKKALQCYKSPGVGCTLTHRRLLRLVHAAAARGRASRGEGGSAGGRGPRAAGRPALKVTRSRRRRPSGRGTPTPRAGRAPEGKEVAVRRLKFERGRASGAGGEASPKHFAGCR